MRDIVRLYRKLFLKPYTATALLLLSVIFFSQEPAANGEVLGEYLLTMVGTRPNSSFGSLLLTPIAPPTKLPQRKTSVIQTPTVSAQSALVLDRASHAILYEKDSNLTLPPASTTKIATAIVTLENYQLDQILTVPLDVYEKSDGSLMGLFPGEKISVENLLWGLLLNSGNDAGYTLAMNFPGGFNAFVKKMNELVQDLQLQNTHFVNTVGFDQEGHFSSVYDLTVLADYGLKNSLFAQMVATDEKEVISAEKLTDLNSIIYHKLKNTNNLLREIVGLKGVKTGWTEAAGFCLVALIRHEQKELIIVVLNSSDRKNDIKALVDWVFSSFDWPQT